MQLDKKLALVTGGVGGLGKAIARKFIAEGAKVVITDIDDAEGKRLCTRDRCYFYSP